MGSFPYSEDPFLPTFSFWIKSKFLTFNISILTLLYMGKPWMGSLANSEDPDEMPQDVAFHQDLHS